MEGMKSNGAMRSNGGEVSSSSSEKAADSIVSSIIFSPKI